MPINKNHIKELLEQIGSSDTVQADVNSEYNNVDLQLKEEELKKARLLNEALKGENEGDTQDRNQRRIFAISVFLFVVLYMAAVMTILFIQGFCDSFYLDKSVLITLLATTTANVLGVLVIVVTYLFSRKKNSDRTRNDNRVAY